MIQKKVLINLTFFLEKFKSKKKIILTSNSNIYLSPKFSIFSQLKLTLFDYFLIKNKKEKKFIDRKLSKEDKNEINIYYHENLDIEKLDNINTKLKKLAQKHDVQILKKQDFQCKMNEKICFGVTDQGKKIYYDNYHYTLEGAKFFGKRIFDINWLKIN